MHMIIFCGSQAVFKSERCNILHPGIGNFGPPKCDLLRKFHGTYGLPLENYLPERANHYQKCRTAIGEHWMHIHKMICISDENFLRLYVTGLETTMTKGQLKTMFPNSKSILLPMNYHKTENRGWVQCQAMLQRDLYYYNEMTPKTKVLLMKVWIRSIL